MAILARVLMVKHLVFWQNFPNHLQSALIGGLATQSDVAVTLVCQDDLPQWRRSIGWQAPDYGNAEVMIQPTHREMQQLLSADPHSTTHIFSGTRGYSMVWQALQQAIKANLKLGIYSEASDWRGAKGLLRLGRARIDQVRFGSSIHFVLAIGHLGVKWFRRSGYKPAQIYPFGYFVDLPNKLDEGVQTKTMSSDMFHIVFIGQGVHRKGVDLLLEALSSLKQDPWRLTVIGSGDDLPAWQRLSVQRTLDARVDFVGTLPNAKAMQLLSGADLLVLPSRWDGWGAVVNEALLRGVPVVCSSYCGAADLLTDPLRGAVFATGSVNDLRAKLFAQLSLGRLQPSRRQKICVWAQQRLSGVAAAQYLLEIVAHSQQPATPRPATPWLLD